jgi:hypothetical protein
MRAGMDDMLTAHTNADEFRPLIQARFTIRLDGAEPVSLELVEVTDLGPAHTSGGRRPFALYFLGPESDRYLRQATYRLEHPTGGWLELFIVPLGPQAGRMRYEAIFN